MDRRRKPPAAECRRQAVPGAPGGSEEVRLRFIQTMVLHEDRRLRTIVVKSHAHKIRPEMRAFSDRLLLRYFVGQQTRWNEIIATITAQPDKTSMRNCAPVALDD